jgi:hypothetical protein
LTAPLVEQWIAARNNIFDDGFIDAYVKVVASALGPLCESPRFLLSTRVLIHWADGNPAADEFNQGVRGIVGQNEWQDLKASTSLGGVVFLTINDLSRLLKNRGVVPRSIVTAVESAARTHEVFAYAWLRSPKASVYFLYGHDQNHLMAATREFVRSDRPLSGLVTTAPTASPKPPR